MGQHGFNVGPTLDCQRLTIYQRCYSMPTFGQRCHAMWVPKTCANRIQSAFNATITRVELIRTETRRAARKYLKVFKTF